jgi:integrase
MSRRRTAPAPRQFDSGRWQARVRDPLTNRLVAIGTFDTKAQADKAQLLAMADQQRGAWRPPDAGRQTFGHWASRYLATTAHLGPKTRANYESTLRCHLLPDLADVELRRLDRPAVRAYFARLTAQGTAAGTVERIRAVMRNVLTAAVEGGALVTNPADRVKIPRTMRTEEPVFLLPDEVEALADAVTNPPRPPRHPQRRHPDLGLLVRFTAYTGLRSSEVAALRVGRVDLLRRRLDVAEAATEGRGGLHFGPTKNYQRRSVPIPGFLVDNLTPLLAGRRSDELVFAAPEGGPFRHGNFYARHFKPAVAHAGLPPRTRFHDLRHTYASRLIAEGATPLTVMRRLGHSSIKVTYDTYGHLLPEQEAALTERLDAIGRAAQPTPSARVTVITQTPNRTYRGHQ